MRRLSGAFALVGVGLAGLGVTASTAGAAITQPPGGPPNPLVVPTDPAGNPVAFTVAANGFPTGSSVFVEQCDGTPATTLGWDPTLNCDLVSSPSPAVADGTGTATFLATDVNRAFRPFKGASPQGNFNCLSPNDSSPNNGLVDFRNCQVRVSTNNSFVTGDQQFFNIQLPDRVTSAKVPSGPLSCTLAITNIIKPPPVVAPAEPVDLNVRGKNRTGVGTAVPGGSCNNSGVVGGQAPITTGEFELKHKLLKPRSCANFQLPDWDPKAKVKVKLQGFAPSATKPTTVATIAATISSVTAFTAPTYGFNVTLVPQKVKKPFAGQPMTITLNSGKTLSALQTECNNGIDPKVGMQWPFTGTLTIS